MKKVALILLVIAGGALLQTAAAQTGGASSSNRSDCHIPPAVKHYLEQHPDVKKKVIHYVKTHGHLPPIPGCPGAGNVAVNTKISWPSTPPAPAAPVVGGN